MAAHRRLPHGTVIVVKRALGDPEMMSVSSAQQDVRLAPIIRGTVVKRPREPSSSTVDDTICVSSSSPPETVQTVSAEPNGTTCSFKPVLFSRTEIGPTPSAPGGEHKKRQAAASGGGGSSVSNVTPVTHQQYVAPTTLVDAYDNKRAVCEWTDHALQAKTTSTTSASTVQVTWLTLPEYLREELWMRHRYSLDDVRKTLEAFPSRLLCQLAVAFGRDVPKTSSRPCSNVDVALQYPNCRVSIVPTLMSVIRQRHPEWGDRPSVTWAIAPQSLQTLSVAAAVSSSAAAKTAALPRIPYHLISRDALQSLVNAVITVEHTSTLMKPRQPSPRLSRIMSPLSLNGSGGGAPMSPLQLTTGPASPPPQALMDVDGLTPPSPSAIVPGTPSSMIMMMDEPMGVQDWKQRTMLALHDDPSHAMTPVFDMELRTTTRVFQWRDIYIVALQANEAKTQVLVCGIIPWAVYARDRGRPTTLAVCPNMVLTPAGPFALTAETFWLAAHPLPSGLSSSPPSSMTTSDSDDNIPSSPTGGATTPPLRKRART